MIVPQIEKLQSWRFRTCRNVFPQNALKKILLFWRVRISAQSFCRNTAMFPTGKLTEKAQQVHDPPPFSEGSALPASALNRTQSCTLGSYFQSYYAEFRTMRRKKSGHHTDVRSFLNITGRLICSLLSRGGCPWSSIRIPGRTGHSQQASPVRTPLYQCVGKICVPSGN